MSKILIMGVLIIALFGCTNNDLLSEKEILEDAPVIVEIQSIENDDEEDKELDNQALVEEEDNSIIESNSIVFEDNHIYIRPHYSEPDALNDPNAIIWNSTASGEYIEVIIKGNVNDFEIVSLGFDENSDLVENDILFSLPKVNNKTVIISTYQPEGIPFEMIRWKNTNGKVYKYLIQEYYTMLDDAELWTIYKLVE